MGSASEFDYHLYLASELKYLDLADYKRMSSELTQLRKMLTSFKLTIRANS